MSAGYYKDKSENVKVSLLISNLTPSVLNLPRSRITGLPFLSVNIRDLSPVMRKGEISDPGEFDILMEAKVKFPTPRHLLNVNFPPPG